MNASSLNTSCRSLASHSAHGLRPPAPRQVYLDGNVFATSYAVPALAKILGLNLQFAGLHTNTLAWLTDYGQRIRQQLAGVQVLSGQINNYYCGNSISENGLDSVQEYYLLRNSLIESGITVDYEWLRIIEEWLAYDAQIAVRLLAMHAQRFVAEKEDSLAQTLAVVKKTIAILFKVLGRIYQIGNLISSQRRWYLHYGSHPSGQITPLSTMLVLEGVFLQPELT